jgi:D-glycero-D-manno-heptose 1,7-bisphosphate phosphatase
LAASGRPAAFLDRDGTIIEDGDYLADDRAVRLLPGAANAIARLNHAGWPVVIVTNQSGIGRGLLTEEQYQATRRRLDEMLAEAGASILATYHCPHAPDEQPPCECRKPAPGLYLRAAAEHDLDLARSVYVGDRLRDILPGLRFGGTGYLLAGRKDDAIEGYPDVAGGERETQGTAEAARTHRVNSLAEAVDHILASRQAPAR